MNREAIVAHGTVKFFNSARGFGYIKPDDGGADVSVHISAVEKSGLRDLHEGQKVSFTCGLSAGRHAVTALKDDDPQ